MNLNDPEVIQQTVEFVGSRFNRIDVLVNNAAFWGGEGPVDQMSIDAWFSVIDQNVKGTYVVTRAAISYLKQKDGEGLCTYPLDLVEQGMPDMTASSFSRL